MRKQKSKWSLPKLILLVRGRKEEAIMTKCYATASCAGMAGTPATSISPS